MHHAPPERSKLEYVAVQGTLFEAEEEKPFHGLVGFR